MLDKQKLARVAEALAPLARIADAVDVLLPPGSIDEVLDVNVSITYGAAASGRTAREEVLAAVNTDSAPLCYDGGQLFWSEAAQEPKNALRFAYLFLEDPYAARAFIEAWCVGDVRDHPEYLAYCGHPPEEISRFEEPKWVKWEGATAACPVDRGALVQLRVADGSLQFGRAGSFNWFHTGGKSGRATDIIAYRTFED